MREITWNCSDYQLFLMTIDSDGNDGYGNQ